MQQLVDVSHVSKRGSSLRITLSKKVQAILGVKEEELHPRRPNYSSYAFLVIRKTSLGSSP